MMLEVTGGHIIIIIIVVIIIRKRIYDNCLLNLWRLSILMFWNNFKKSHLVICFYFFLFFKLSIKNSNNNKNILKKIFSQYITN